MIKECIRELVKEGAFNEVLSEEVSNVAKSDELLHVIWYPQKILLTLQKQEC